MGNSKKEEFFTEHEFLCELYVLSFTSTSISGFLCEIEEVVFLWRTAPFEDFLIKTDLTGCICNYSP